MESRNDFTVPFSPHRRVERFAEAVAGEGDAGFGFLERGAEIFGRGLRPAEEGDGIDLEEENLSVKGFARLAFIRAEAEPFRCGAPEL